MNLQSAIDQRLWTAVERSYEDGNYSGAISDCFYFLSDLIRDKSGLDSDGASLIGSAFGGESPIIKVNALQTETDRSEQKGVEQILRGLYLGLRNPRSHEKRSDAANTADSVISFVNFLVGLIDRSKSPFDIEQIVQKVFDKHFAPTADYAKALACRVPAGKRYDVLAEVFLRRTQGKIENIRMFLRSLLESMPESSQQAFWELVSTTLEEATADADVRTAVGIADDDWGKLSEIARLRTENRLIGSILEGEYDSHNDSCLKGTLGSWALRISEHMLSQRQFRNALLSRLAVDDEKASAYVMEFFSKDIIKKDEPVEPILAFRLKRRLDADDKRVFGSLWFLAMGTFHESWGQHLDTAYKEFLKRNPELSDDDIPF